MTDAPREKVYDRPAEPFSSDPRIASAQLEKMRPRLNYYFQSKNVLPSHDEQLTEQTIDKVWDQYSKGNEIRDRRAYTYQVAKSLLTRYINKGLELEVQPSEIHELSNPSSLQFTEHINARLDNQKKWSCVMECRQKLIARKNFSEEKINAFFKYKLIEGHAKEGRDLIAHGLGVSREVLDQVIQNIKKELVNCTRECMSRSRNIASEFRSQ